MSNYQKGASTERDLERRLWESGWQTFRVAGSGSVGHASADVVAMRGDEVGGSKKLSVMVFEVKDVSQFPVRIDMDQINEIIDRTLGAVEAYVYASISGKGDRVYIAHKKITEDSEWVYPYEVIE